MRRGKAVRAVTRTGEFSFEQVAGSQGMISTASGDVTKTDTLKQALAGCSAALFCASASKVPICTKRQGTLLCVKRESFPSSNCTVCSYFVLRSTFYMRPACDTVWFWRCADFQADPNVSCQTRFGAGGVLIFSHIVMSKCWRYACKQDNMLDNILVWKYWEDRVL